jgi:PAS domain S-box-containing protein
MAEDDTVSLRDELYSLLKTDDHALRFLLDRVLDGIWYTDLGRPGHEWLSPSYKALFGYQDHEVPDDGDWWRRNIFAEDLAVADDSLARALANPDEDYENVVRFRHREGHAVWVRSRGHVIRDNAGRPVRMLGCHVDVTRRMELEQIDRFRTIIDHCVSGIYVFDAETLKFVEVNSSTRQRLGYSADELAGMTPFDIGQPRTRDQYETVLAPLRRHEAPFIVYESVHRCKDGSTYPIEVHTELLERAGERPVFLAFSNDISERKRRESELAASQEFNQIILNSVSDGIATLKPLWQDGRLVDFTVGIANHAMRRQFHLYKGPLSGARLGELMPDLGEAERFKRLVAVADGGSAFAAEIGPGGGSTDWHLVRASRMPSGELVVTCINIAAAKERELSLRKSNAALKRFSAIVSHDLQAPLRHIGLFAEMLEGKLAQSDEELRFLSSRIRGNAERMQRMIAGLLDYTSVAYAQIRHEPVDLDAVVADVLTLIEADVVAAGARIEYAGLPVVTGDRDLLTRLFQNLIANAVKYRADATPHVVIASTRVGDAWELSVADNGIGIDPRFAERIFDVFSRLHRDETSFPGMGIGLAVCRQIVESHRGEIRLDTDYDAGACFRFSLPAD